MSFRIQFKLSSIILSKDVIHSALSKFWSDAFNNDLNNYILFIPRVKYTNGKVSTLTNMLRLNKIDLSFAQQHIMHVLSNKSESYQEDIILEIFFDYTFRDGLAPAKQ